MFRFSNSPEGGGLGEPWVLPGGFGGISEAEPTVLPRWLAGPLLYSTYKWSQSHT